MKIRAILLIAILIGGMYVMIQSFDDDKVKGFSELLNNRKDPFVSLEFTKPSVLGSPPDAWTVKEESQIEELLLFLQNYNVKKIYPEEINVEDDKVQFSIRLEDSQGDMIMIVVNENLIIENSTHYYEIVDGPLDIEWLVQFFVQNEYS